MHKAASDIKNIIDESETIVIVQADNPDADSLGSALSMEQILAGLNKQTYLYCGVDMPTYLRYMDGWDRVSPDLPKKFDASVIVDASTMTLLEKLKGSGQKGWLATKPCLVLDHHQSVENIIPFASVMINDHSRASTGELIYLLASELKWPLNLAAKEFIVLSILGDTQGLSNQLATPDTYRLVADLIEQGVSRPALEEKRRLLARMPEEIFRYKADLIKRTKLSSNKDIAWVVVPQEEINKFSPLYNPAPLIQSDMLQTDKIEVAIVIKSYADGKITGAIRTNPASPIAAELAEHFGGGGHAHASGFKITSGRSPADVETQCIKKAEELLAKAS